MGSDPASSAVTGAVTIGVAIAVPEPYASELRELRASFGDLQARTVPTHVTLVPPLTVHADDLGRIDRHLADVAGRHGAFAMRLRGAGTFQPVSPVVFVAVAQGISECELLAHDVRNGPLAVRLDYPYHPHVTVAHHVEQAGLDRAFDCLAGYRCDFDVTAFARFAHHDGEGWREHRTYPLSGAEEAR